MRRTEGRLPAGARATAGLASAGDAEDASPHGGSHSRDAAFGTLEKAGQLFASAKRAPCRNLAPVNNGRWSEFTRIFQQWSTVASSDFNGNITSDRRNADCISTGATNGKSIGDSAIQLCDAALGAFRGCDPRGDARTDGADHRGRGKASSP